MKAEDALPNTLYNCNLLVGVGNNAYYVLVITRR